MDKAKRKSFLNVTHYCIMPIELHSKCSGAYKLIIGFVVEKICLNIVSNLKVTAMA